mmetsp:Transcript_52931/g.133746  ORF Transcript_52931/g.133746 Transcript_52931/m.133746 type:complete len:351 (-) Transcript_52931:31-1083(-)
MQGAQDLHVRGLKGRVPGEQLEEHDAGTPQVALAAVVAVENLRSRVQQGPRHGVHRGSISGGLRKAEVEELQHLGGHVLEPEVLGLDVPVHDAQVVHRVHRRQDLLRQAANSQYWQVLTLLLDLIDEVQTATSLHHGVEGVVRVHEAVVFDDVRVLDPQALAEDPHLLVLADLRHSRHAASLEGNHLHTKRPRLVVLVAKLTLQVSASEDFAKAALTDFLADGIQLLKLRLASFEPQKQRPICTFTSTSPRPEVPRRALPPQPREHSEQPVGESGRETQRVEDRGRRGLRRRLPGLELCEVDGLVHGWLFKRRLPLRPRGGGESGNGGATTNCLRRAERARPCKRERGSM